MFLCTNRVCVFYNYVNEPPIVNWFCLVFDHRVLDLYFLYTLFGNNFINLFINFEYNFLFYLFNYEIIPLFTLYNVRVSIEYCVCIWFRNSVVHRSHEFRSKLHRFFCLCWFCFLTFWINIFGLWLNIIYVFVLKVDNILRTCAWQYLQ